MHLLIENVRLHFTQGILERLDAGEIVIGDGGFVFALEKRGYVKAGPWTPEAAAEHPESGTPFFVTPLNRSVTCVQKNIKKAVAFQCASCTESF